VLLLLFFFFAAVSTIGATLSFVASTTVKCESSFCIEIFGFHTKVFSAPAELSARLGIAKLSIVNVHNAATQRRSDMVCFLRDKMDQPVWLSASQTCRRAGFQQSLIHRRAFGEDLGPQGRRLTNELKWLARFGPVSGWLKRSRSVAKNEFSVQMGWRSIPLPVVGFAGVT
jgi:hypothetical protein